MKLIEFDGKQFVFQLDRREKRLLQNLLGLYPLIPPGHHRVSKSGSTAESSSQQLLDEALAEQRREYKTQLETMLKEEGRFRPAKPGYHFVLSPEQLEWLLQVLNDVRVGSWILLGEPDEKRGKQIALTEQNARYLWSMELAGYFQALLLSAFESRA